MMPESADTQALARLQARFFCCRWLVFFVAAGCSVMQCAAEAHRAADATSTAAARNTKRNKKVTGIFVLNLCSRGA